MTKASVYNRVKTGYTIVTARNLDAWRGFGSDALGFHLDDHGKDLISFRIDGRERRLIVRQHAKDDVQGVGLEIADQAALDIVLKRLAERNVVVSEIDGAEADIRGVDRFWQFVGPKEMDIELFLTAHEATSPLSIKQSGFCVGDGGQCHYAIPTREAGAMLGFWQEIFDARISDYIEEKLPGINLLITFARLNERHHSLAIAETKGVRMDVEPTRIHHMAFEVNTVQDVLATYERCREAGHKIVMGLGKHTNDQQVSFYVATPSGFAIEIGSEPIRITDDIGAWDEGKVHQGISRWGHVPENHGFMDELSQISRGIRSLFRSEYKAF